MLKQRVMKALAWQAGAKLVSQLFSFAVTILLARMLLPEDFGLLGMALVFTGFIDLVNEMGIGSSIIRRQETSQQELSSIFWFAIMVGCGLYTLTFFAAPLVALFFRNNAVTDIVRVLGLNLIIGSLRAVPFGLLTRELHFAQRSRSEIFAALTGGSTALLLAWAGFGIWSLVLNSLASGIVLMLLCYWFSGWRPLMFFRFALAREMVGFGAKIMISRMQWYAYSNADFFIVGRLLGKLSLGYYTMAFNLAVLPTEKITAIVNQVMFPAFAKLQDDLGQLRQAFSKTTRYVSMLTFPLLAIMVVFAPEIIAGLLTEKWLPSVFPFRVLCVVGFLRSIDVIIPQMLLARGRSDLVLKYSTLLLCVLPTAFGIGCYFGGIDGVAYAWLLVYPPLAAILFHIGLKELALPLAEYLQVLSPQACGAGLMVLVLVPAKLVLLSLNIFPTLMLVVLGGVCGLLIFVGHFRLFHPGTLREIIAEVKTFRQAPADVGGI